MALKPESKFFSSALPIVPVLFFISVVVDFLRSRIFILDIVDPAILRPGRLDKILFLGFPTAEDRADILRAVTKVEYFRLRP